MSSNPLIVEVRANEFANKDMNPHVPLGAEQLIADAADCAAAGAAVYHWHARHTDGSDHPDDTALNARIIDGIRARADLVLHATLGFIATQGDAASRVAAIRKLVETGHAPDIIPIDVGAIISDEWDATAHRFRSGDSAVLNHTGYLEELVEEVRDLDLPVEVVVWSPGAVRTALRLRERGLLTMPVYWQLGFTGAAIPGGAPATPRQLEAFVDELPAGEPWNLHVRTGDGLALAAHAVLRGGHIAIGLGDDPYVRLGSPTNADLVTRFTHFAETIGRPVATTAVTRELLGIDGAHQESQ